MPPLPNTPLLPWPLSPSPSFHNLLSPALRLCCAQFVVSADRIRARPHAFWRRLLADLLDPAVPQVCKVSGHVLEMTWGWMLGEPPNATCRKDGWGAIGAMGYRE